MQETTKKNKTFVFNGTEIRLTGRVAQRKNTRKLTRTSNISIAGLVEITPMDSENGSWKKWVRRTELFEIKG